MSMLPKWRLLFEERCDTTEVFCFNQKIFIWNYYDPIFYSNNLTGIKHFHWARAGGNGFKLPCARQSPSAMTTYLRHPNSYLLPRGSSPVSESFPYPTPTMSTAFSLVHWLKLTFFSAGGWVRGALYMAYGILIPQPGIECMPPAVEAWSLNHRTAREVSKLTF